MFAFVWISLLCYIRFIECIEHTNLKVWELTESDVGNETTATITAAIVLFMCACVYDGEQQKCWWHGTFSNILSKMQKCTRNSDSEKLLNTALILAHNGQTFSVAHSSFNGSISCEPDGERNER